MTWPRFDFALAINQLVAASYTIVGVFVGGYLAFRLGLRQLRNARAIDRRLEWNEQLHEALSAYSAGVNVLLGEYEREDDEPDREFRQTALEEARRDSAKVIASLQRTKFYGSASGRAEAAAIYAIHVQAHLALWHVTADDAPAADVLQALKIGAAAIETAPFVIVDRVRKDLGLSTRAEKKHTAALIARWQGDLQDQGEENKPAG